LLRLFLRDFGYLVFFGWCRRGQLTDKSINPIKEALSVTCRKAHLLELRDLFSGLLHMLAATGLADLLQKLLVVSEALLYSRSAWLFLVRADDGSSLHDQLNLGRLLALIKFNNIAFANWAFLSFHRCLRPFGCFLSLNHVDCAASFQRLL
jgi:hypothetical protein